MKITIIMILVYVIAALVGVLLGFMDDAVNERLKKLKRVNGGEMGDDDPVGTDVCTGICGGIGDD